MRFILAAALLVSSAYCQTATTGQAQTTGPCSPASSGSNNNFTIHCGIGQEQGLKLLAIVNRILAKQLDPDLVMSKLDEIETDVKKISRGNYSTYDFNGVKRELHSGVVKAVAGEEFVAFQTMVKLHGTQQWKELLETSEGQLKKTPDWLTPYLFSGIANANLGNRQAAIDRLTFVKDQAAGDPAYADADRILQELQQRP
jgi:hypothetical protein